MTCTLPNIWASDACNRQKGLTVENGIKPIKIIMASSPAPGAQKPNNHSAQFLIKFSVSIHVQEHSLLLNLWHWEGKKKSQIMLNKSYFETMCSLSFQCGPRSRFSESIRGHFATNTLASSELSFLRCSISDAIKTLVKHTLRGTIFTSLLGSFWMT